jgi:hypothetical protein
MKWCGREVTPSYVRIIWTKDGMSKGGAFYPHIDLTTRVTLLENAECLVICNHDMLTDQCLFLLGNIPERWRDQWGSCL